MERTQEPESVLGWVEDLLELPMAILSFALLVLVAVEYLVPLTPGQQRVLVLTDWLIWAVFVLHFIVTFSLSRRKDHYLHRNWIILVSLILPFFRIFTLARALRAVRVLRIARLMTVTNRAIRQLGLVLQARRILFVTASSVIVALISAVGAYFLERGAVGSEINTFGEALWWSTRSVMNADIPIAPVTPEGRFLGVMVSLYGFAVFGVITAALASWFVESDRREEERRATREGQEAHTLDTKIQEDLRSRPKDIMEIRERLDQLLSLLEERRRMTQQTEDEM